MNKIKNQHYVPQFYLRFFSFDKDCVFVLDKPTLKKFHSNVDRVACDNYFYDSELLDLRFEKEQFLEKWFHPLETQTAITISELIQDLNNNSSYKISKDLKEKLSPFIHFQLLRTDTVRTELNQMKTLLFDVLKTAGASKEQIESDEKELQDVTGKSQQINMILDPDFTKSGIERILNKNWVLCKNTTNEHFFTSDSPVTRRVYFEKHHLALEIFLPISPLYGIALYEKPFFSIMDRFENRLIDIKDVEPIRYYNDLQTQNAKRQLYSFTKDFHGAVELITRHPELQDLNRQRMQH